MVAHVRITLLLMRVPFLLGPKFMTSKQDVWEDAQIIRSRAQVGDWETGAGGIPNITHDPNRQSQGMRRGEGAPGGRAACR